MGILWSVWRYNLNSVYLQYHANFHITKGGYNLLSIAHSALAVTKVLLGEPPGVIESMFPSAAAIETCQQVMLHQSKYWNCMSIKTIFPGMP